MDNEQQLVAEEPIQTHKLENEPHDGFAVSFIGTELHTRRCPFLSSI